jgi:hypothetical protein
MKNTSAWPDSEKPSGANSANFTTGGNGGLISISGIGQKATVAVTFEIVGDAR